MELEVIVAHLRRIPLFQNLRPDQDARDERELYLVAKIVQEAEYTPGEWLFGQGEPADRLYYVLRGRIRLTRLGADGVRADLGVKQPGDAFGETGLLVGDFHDATAEAMSPVRVLYLERGDFLPLLEQRPRLEKRLAVSHDLARQQQIPRFSWMREGEWAIHVGPRHVIGLIRQAILPVLALFLVAVLAFLMAYWGWRGGVLALPLLLGLLPAGLLAWDYIDWHDDRFILTTQRVMHLERKGPFGSMSEEAALDDIQDVLEVRPNAIANLLDYGDIILQTAGGTVKIDFTEVGTPSKWRELILREMGRIQARRVVRMRGEVREQLESRLNLAPPPEPKVVAVETPKPGAAVKLLANTIMELFFPASWVRSPDGLTIKWRRYWLPGFIRYGWVSLLFLLATFGGFWAVAASLGDSQAATSAQEASLDPVLLIGWLFLEVILLGVVMWYIEDWRNDFFEITPTHIIHVNRQPLWGRMTRLEARLDRIQNITSDVPSIWARLFKYGNVILETAAADGKFEIRFVRDPEGVRAEISRRQQEFRKRDLTRQAAQRQDELLSWFTIYDSLRHAEEHPELLDEESDAADTDIS